MVWYEAELCSQVNKTVLGSFVMMLISKLSSATTVLLFSGAVATNQLKKNIKKKHVSLPADMFRDLNMIKPAIIAVPTL